MSSLGDKLRAIADDVDGDEDIRGIAIVAAGELVYEVACSDDEIDDEQTINGLASLIAQIVEDHPVGSFATLN